MSAIKFVNARGQVRWQPELPNGLRLWSVGSWGLSPEVTPKEAARRRQPLAPPWYEPKLYRSKSKAERIARMALVENERFEAGRFREAK